MTDDSSNELKSIGAAVDALRVRHPEVTHSSLRFLEREGLLHSTRTPGGHRLYSSSDLERVELIKRWQRQGSSLDDIRELLEIRDGLQDAAQLSSMFLDLAVAYRLEEAEQLILQCDQSGLDLDTIFFHVLQPALAEVGERWASGALPVHQEKEILAMCRALVADLTLRNSSADADGPLLLAACVEGESHEIGLSMICGALRQRGFRIRYLGPDVATNFLADAVETDQPDGVLLSATIEANLAGMRAAVAAVRETTQGSVSVFAGGGAAIRNREVLVELGALVPENGGLVQGLAEFLMPPVAGQ